jgi:proteasome lid subunit RPN8/RPN11
MQEHPGAQVIISVDAQKALFTDAHQRQDIEACGLLTGCIDDDGNWYVERVHPLRNIFNSSVYFEFEPEDVLAVELEYPGKVVGAYHSHPTGFPAASSTDRANMRRLNVEGESPWVWLIVIGPFHEEKGQYKTVAYHYYELEGLRKIPLELEARTEIEEDTEAIPDNTHKAQQMMMKKRSDIWVEE